MLVKVAHIGFIRAVLHGVNAFDTRVVLGAMFTPVRGVSGCINAAAIFNYPAAIRYDNGPEYISSALLMWAKTHNIRIEHIQPGKPQQNAYVERYNRTVRYDWLTQYLFGSIDEVQVSATRWLCTHNHERPNMALGGITPIQKLMLAA